MLIYLAWFGGGHSLACCERVYGLQCLFACLNPSGDGMLT